MAGGLFRRLKTWGLTEILQNTDLNKEFDNIKNNFMPQMMAGYSQSVSQSNIQTSPGATGSESLPNALSGELERLRYQLAAIIGDSGGLWRATPVLSLAQINTSLVPGTLSANRLVSGRQRTGSKQPMHLVPGGASNGVTLKATTTPFVCYINGTKYTFSADITLTGLTTAPSTNNTAALNDGVLDGSAKTRQWGDYRADFSPYSSGINPIDGAPLSDQSLYIQTIGSNIAALAGNYGAFKYSHGGSTEYFIGRMSSATGPIDKCFRGFFFDSADAPIKSIGMTTAETITLMQLTWVYLSTTGTLGVSYTNPRWSYASPVSPAIGDRWYDLTNQTWKSYSGSSWLATNDTLVGICVQDGTNTVAARSFDMYGAYSSDSSVVPEWYSTSEIRSRFINEKVNVYGQVISFDRDFVRWNTGTDFDSGITQTSSTVYFAYLTENGKPVISDSPPHRRLDLGGYYHPHQSWRCLAMIYSNGSTQLDSVLLAPVAGISGEQISDKSVSISKRKFPGVYPGLTGGIDGVALSSSIKGVAITSATDVNVQDINSANLTVGLNTTGRPVLLMLWHQGYCDSVANNDNFFILTPKNNGNALNSVITGWSAGNTAVANNSKFYSGPFIAIDFPAPGAQSYTLKARVNSVNSSLALGGGYLIAMEI